MMKPQASFRGGRFGWEQAGLVTSLTDWEHLAPWGPVLCTSRPSASTMRISGSGRCPPRGPGNPRHFLRCSD